MSGFDLASMLPFYLDEVDEQIAALNDTLLGLERVPDDDKALRDAFRLVHTIKGSSSMMGFEPVKELTHHLETFFDQLRSRKRTLDRPFLDLCFRGLDALRDYHRDLRSEGKSDVDLSGLTTLILALPDPSIPPAVEPPAPEPAVPGPPTPSTESPPLLAGPSRTSSEAAPGQQDTIRLTLLFEPNLKWPDMKAKLVLNRLGAKGRILATAPPSDRLEEVEDLPKLSIWLLSDCDIGELHALADVDGVTEIQVESGPWPDVEAEGRADSPPATVRPQPRPEARPRSQSDVPLTVEPAPSVPGLSASASVPGREVRPPSETLPLAHPIEKLEVEPKRVKVTETVRVDVERLDQLMNLAGELVINKSRFFEIARGLDELFRTSNAQLLAADTLDRLDNLAHGLEGFDDRERLVNGSLDRWTSQLRRLRENFRSIHEELDLIRQGREQLGAMSEAIHHLSRVSDGIQRGVLETRMVPIGPLFDRFQRVIRDLRLASNKEVVLRIEGEKTELDKRMIDELGDPLIHLVRNSVDHGLELPDRREAAGKPRAGTVSLSASHRGNSIVITVADDGRGIDCERVRVKAVGRGLISEAESRHLTERQLIQYIWHPGLSTAEAITDISGRGVGMDIVKSRIEGLNGTVDVRSEPGRGTSFTIRLPLTLAIMSVLLARVGEEFYAIPLDHLAEIVEVGPGQLHRVQGHWSIEIRGRIISLIALADVFPDRTADRAGMKNGVGEADLKRTVVVVSDGEATMGLIVDELLGMQEAVLKSLEKNFRPVAGLCGASILGDGRVSLILDIDALIGMVASEARRGGR